MSDVAVRIEGLGKMYQIMPVHRPTLLREAVTDWFRSVAARRDRAKANRIWAVRNVSLEVKHGESFGIIGSNGSGKSTLLKMLAGITEPTEGNAWIRGRVGCLLEVGTGFHQELTGRENTYLNGAILGMRKREIDKKFEEIVEFSGVARFIDTPVKRYSSGMYLRLAFSVAAHLEPEILIVDEVLAVGDASFQRRCIGKMAEVAREGRTVLFVSHNMTAVQSLCSKAALLQGGRQVCVGPVNQVVDEYVRITERSAVKTKSDNSTRLASGNCRLLDIDIQNGARSAVRTLIAGSPVRFVFQLDSFTPGISVWFSIVDQQGRPICSFHSRVYSPEDSHDMEVKSDVLCDVSELPLVPGHYQINAAVFLDHQLVDQLEGAAEFEVVEGVLRGRAITSANALGWVQLPHRWVLPAERYRG